MAFRRRFNTPAVLVASVCASIGMNALFASPAAADPLPTWSAPVLVDAGSILRDVSCPSTSLCVAVDFSGNVLTTSHPDGGASAWTVANVDGANRVYRVSCTSSPLCIAVDSAGNVLSSTDPTGGPSAWHAVKVEAPEQLNDVSCASTSLCVAVDAAGNVIVSTEPTGGAEAWTITNIDVLKHIAGVTCIPSGLCVAVANSGLLFTSTDPTGGASAWHLAHVDAGHGIDQVACPSASLCVAVDAEENVLTSTEPTGGAEAWTAFHFDPGGGEVEGVSCSSTSLCVAVDSSGGALASTEPAGGVAAWTRTEIDSFGLSSVSCPLAALCVAVDEHGQVVTAGVWRHGLSVLAQGTGSGTVTSSVGAISCPAACSASLPTGAQVTLSATAAAGSTFAGWSGGCAGTGACRITLGEDTSVVATFTALPAARHSLTVTRSGSGQGVVQSSPSGISCGPVCSATFPSGQAVTLTAIPTGTSRFIGWGGACTGTASTCTLTLGSDQSVTAAFLAPPSIRGLSITPRAFRAASSGPSTQRPGHGGNHGATVRYTLSEPATVRLRVEQLLPGRKTGKGRGVRCVAPTARNRKAPRCTRTVSLRASFTTSGRAGANTFVFTGRLAGKKLAAGSYVLIATPSASGMSGSPSSVSFRIIS